MSAVMWVWRELLFVGLSAPEMEFRKALPRATAYACPDLLNGLESEHTISAFRPLISSDRLDRNDRSPTEAPRHQLGSLG